VIRAFREELNDRQNVVARRFIHQLASSFVVTVVTVVILLVSAASRDGIRPYETTVGGRFADPEQSRPVRDRVRQRRLVHVLGS
jgi:hypothetical protein